MNKQHKVVVITPAGRKKYLQILKKYILTESFIDEWHLWDNCRDIKDRDYLKELSNESNKIKIISEPNVDGSFRSISKFFKYASSPDTFYIRVDDDVVFAENGFTEKLYKRALLEKDKYLFWGPLVINNAICTYLLYSKGIIKTNVTLFNDCLCLTGWGNPLFAEKLHWNFIQKLIKSQINEFKLNEDYVLPKQRYSINCIAFWGETAQKLGGALCSDDVLDEEQYITVDLTNKTGMHGKIFTDIIVAHFAFYTQECFLLKHTKILQLYAQLAGYENYTF
ncbi:MAG TPA: hypothetical protein PLP99_03830 [Ignavibacteriales bacterium]|nr:hypothetical protein [Ignavibacteriales bacterium]HOL80874.1 hypothetical protein [Ignavibacteriales bacterium]HPP33309.1 hypothetical protein [Ignavibacteriales bacterium]